MLPGARLAVSQRLLRQGCRRLGLLVGGLVLLFLAPAAQSGILDLSWDAPTTNSDGTALTDLSAYRVYSGTSSAPCPGSSYQVVPSPAPAPTVGDVINYQLTGLNTGTTYFVRVTAVDTGGNESACSNQATGQAKADPLDTSAPTGAITINNNASSTNWTAATLSLAATDAVGVTAYYVSTISTSPSATTTGWVAVTATTSFSNNNVPYTLSSGNGTKTVYAWYKDAAGNVSATASDAILLDQTAPSNGTLTATAGNAQVSLSWSGFADGGSGLAGTNRYKLVFSTGGTPASSCTSGTQLLLGTATSFTHSGLTSGTTHYYRVCALDNAGNTSTGATASATPQASDTAAPTLSITSPTSGTTYSTRSSPLTLGGTASDTVGVTQVTWANDRGGSGTASGTTSWTVSGIGLQSGTNVLTVTARDAAGNTGTDTLTVTYTPLDTTAPTGTLTINGTTAATNATAATLNLSASDTVGVTGYYLSTSSTSPAAGAAGWVAVTATTSFSSNVAYTLSSWDGIKTIYAWYKDGAGNMSARASDSIRLDRTPPSNGTLTATAGNAQVSLSWSGFADWGSGLAGTNRYKLVFSTGGTPASSCTSGTQLLLGTATSFTHSGLTNGTTYYYRVCARDNAGNTSTGAAASRRP